jgi:ABC-type Mn2+/Zn2+ transport system permease subunit
MLLIGWLVAAAGSIGGGIVSFALDLPTGAAIVCVLGTILAVLGGVVRLRSCKTPPPPERSIGN